MTTTLRTLAAASAAALLLTLAACSQTPTATEPSASAPASDGECAGVTIVVDASMLELDDDPSQQTCVETDTAIAASDALDEADVTTEGTVQYVDAVCRVNGVPAEDFAIPAEDGSDYFETCEAMPAAFAYWSLWVQPEGGEWEYAQEGVSTLQLEPGESLALVFTLNGEPAEPAA